MRFFLFLFLFMLTQSYAACHSAKRIISLSPHLTESLFVIGAGDQVIARDSASDLPKKALSLPVVANYASLNQEAILLLKPDLIVVWQASPWIAKLKKLHIPVYVSDPHHLADIPMMLHDLGCLTGHEHEAREEAQLFLSHYLALKKKYSREHAISVFYVIWPRPLMTITQSSWINEAIELCGGKTIFADLIGSAPIVDEEAVLLNNPDVIMGAEVNRWKRWSNLSAVKNHRLYEMNESALLRPSPFLLDAVEKMCVTLASESE